eukprot:scaffold3166_cov399-Prasinococcus_capsulatus_cf.AAC.23
MREGSRTAGRPRPRAQLRGGQPHAIGALRGGSTARAARCARDAGGTQSGSDLTNLPGYKNASSHSSLPHSSTQIEARSTPSTSLPLRKPQNPPKWLSRPIAPRACGEICHVADLTRRTFMGGPRRSLLT